MPASRVVTRAVNDVLALAPRHGEVSLTRLVEAVSDSRESRFANAATINCVQNCSHKSVDYSQG